MKKMPNICLVLFCVIKIALSSSRVGGGFTVDHKTGARKSDVVTFIIYVN